MEDSRGMAYAGHFKEYFVCCVDVAILWIYPGASPFNYLTSVVVFFNPWRANMCQHHLGCFGLRHEFMFVLNSLILEPMLVACFSNQQSLGRLGKQTVAMTAASFLYCQQKIYSVLKNNARISKRTKAEKFGFKTAYILWARILLNSCMSAVTLHYPAYQWNGRLEMNS